MDALGNLYGTTTGGGLTVCPTVAGCGVVFKLSPNNALTVSESGSGTVTSSPAGINCPGTCGAGFAEDTVVSLTEMPASGFSFGGWGGVCSGPGTCIITMNAAQSVSASFTQGTSPPSPLVSAVLPASRSAVVNNAVTAFATMINTSSSTALGCAIAPTGTLPAYFTYQTTNPSTNALTGTANTPVNIPANNGAQSFVVALTPTAAFNPTNLGFSFACTGISPAPSAIGLNTLLVSASTSPVPDIVALSASVSNDGILHIVGANGSAAFAVATVDVGAASTVTASANTGTANLPLTLTLCQTSPQTGACLASPSASVMATIAANATPTFGIFATASGAIPFDPANSRIFVQFTDSNGTIRGETNVAVETQ
jgi:uncharacterized repeat protein (TIGR03803 family)